MRWTIVLLGTMLLGTGAVSGQTVVGRVVDASNGTPIVLAEVALLDSARQIVDRTFTDHEGSFQLTSGEAGDFYLLAASMSYLPGLDGVLEIAEGGMITVDFFLRPAPVALDRLTVTTDGLKARLTDQGFYERRDVGRGMFLTPEEIEASGASDVSTLLSQFPGISSDRHFSAGAALGPARIYFRDRGATIPCEGGGCRPEEEEPPGFCTPTLYVDGIRIHAHSTGAEVDSRADTYDLAGVEVYRFANQAPIEYGAFSTCGVILLWTKR